MATISDSSTKPPAFVCFRADGFFSAADAFFAGERRLADVAFFADFFDDFFGDFFRDFFGAFLAVAAFFAVFLAFVALRLLVFARFFARAWAAPARVDLAAFLAFRFFAVFFLALATTNSFVA
jgi:hypothetical protein